MEAISSNLTRNSTPPSTLGLSARVMERAAPELGRLARRRYRRSVAAGIAAALLPLPAVLVYGVYLMRAIHSAVSVILPSEIATYLVGSYSVTLVLLLALTYAAIPLMAEDRASRGALASQAR